MDVCSVSIVIPYLVGDRGKGLLISAILLACGRGLVAGVEHFELVIEHFDFGGGDRGSDRKSTRLNSSHVRTPRMPSSA